MRARIWLLVLGGLSACGGEATPPDGGLSSEAGTQTDAGPRTFTFIVGTEGATLSAERLTLKIPPGALTVSTTITVQVEDLESVGNDEVLGPVFTLGPAGLEFEDSIGVEIALPSSEPGTLLWSKQGDPNNFERIGYAFQGRAFGHARHFCRAFVARGACITPNSAGLSECQCRATDGRGDLLAARRPGSLDGMCGEGWPPEPAGGPFSGAEGGPCSGYGVRTVERRVCFCSTAPGRPDNQNLCPTPFDLRDNTPSCEPDGTRSFYYLVATEAEGGRCSGWYVDYDGQGRPMNRRASGTRVDCANADYDDRVRVDGALEGCVATGRALPMGTQLCPPGSNGRGLSHACAELLAASSTTQACPGNARSYGSRVGRYIEEELFSAPPNTTRQVTVPRGSKRPCRATPSLPGNSSNAGFLDLVRVVSRTTESIDIEIGEVKPLTQTGLADGVDDIDNCYPGPVMGAGLRCNMNPTGAALSFCQKLGAVGKTVNLRNSRTGLGAGPVCAPPTTPGGMPQRIVIHECTPGVTAYRCVP